MNMEGDPLVGGQAGDFELHENPGGRRRQFGRTVVLARLVDEPDRHRFLRERHRGGRRKHGRYE